MINEKIIKCTNMHLNYYTSNFIINPPTAAAGTVAPVEVPVEFKFDYMPWIKAKPVFSAMMGDLSVYYPFFKKKLPMIKFQIHVGGGVSFFYSTPVMNAKFAKKFLEKADQEDIVALFADIDALNEEAAKNLATELGKSLMDEGMNSGMGGHVLVGSRFKVLMLNVYANAKYYFGGQTDDQYTKGPTFELGGGFGF